MVGSKVVGNDWKQGSRPRETSGASEGGRVAQKMEPAEGELGSFRKTGDGPGSDWRRPGCPEDGAGRGGAWELSEEAGLPRRWSQPRGSSGTAGGGWVAQKMEPVERELGSFRGVSELGPSRLGGDGAESLELGPLARGLPGRKEPEDWEPEVAKTETTRSRDETIVLQVPKARSKVKLGRRRMLWCYGLSCMWGTLESCNMDVGGCVVEVGEVVANGGKPRSVAGSMVISHITGFS